MHFQKKTSSIYLIHATYICVYDCMCVYECMCTWMCTCEHTPHTFSSNTRIYVIKISNTIIVHTSHIPLTHTTHICVYDCMSVSVYVHAYVCVSEYTCTWMCICEHHLHILQKSRMYYICVCNLFRYVIHVAFICWKQTYICHIHPHKKNVLQKSRM